MSALSTTHSGVAVHHWFNTYLEKDQYLSHPSFARTQFSHVHAPQIRSTVSETGVQRFENPLVVHPLVANLGTSQNFSAASSSGPHVGPSRALIEFEFLPEGFGPLRWHIDLSSAFETRLCPSLIGILKTLLAIRSGAGVSNATTKFRHRMRSSRSTR